MNFRTEAGRDGRRHSVRTVRTEVIVVEEQRLWLLHAEHDDMCPVCGHTLGKAPAAERCAHLTGGDADPERRA